MAVGSFDGSAGTLAEAWNGHAWSVRPSLSPGGNPDELFGVSCTGPSLSQARIRVSSLETRGAAGFGEDTLSAVVCSRQPV